MLLRLMDESDIPLQEHELVGKLPMLSNCGLLPQELLNVSVWAWFFC